MPFASIIGPGVTVLTSGNIYKATAQLMIDQSIKSNRLIGMIQPKGLANLKEKELFSLFENRLDLLLYRLNLVSSLFEAKQLISHGKVFIDGKINRNYSYSLTKGNVISFKKSTEAIFKDRLISSSKNFYFYSYDNLEVCYKTFKIIILTEKVDSKKYLQHYSYFLNWSNLLIK